MNAPLVTISRRACALQLEINRAARSNALTDEVLVALSHALQQAEVAERAYRLQGAVEALPDGAAKDTVQQQLDQTNQGIDAHSQELLAGFDALVAGYQMGKAAAPLFGVRWDQRWSASLEHLREDLEIETSRSRPRRRVVRGSCSPMSATRPSGARTLDLTSKGIAW